MEAISTESDCMYDDGRGGRERRKSGKAPSRSWGSAEVEDELRRDGDAVERQESQHAAVDGSEM